MAHSAKSIEIIMGSTKSQAPNDKQAPMNEIPKSKPNRFGYWRLGIGIYLGFGICDLGF
jgi:hypothetical protein